MSGITKYYKRFRQGDYEYYSISQDIDDTYWLEFSDWQNAYSQGGGLPDGSDTEITEEEWIVACLK